ncbi:MAG: Na/Pi cotransporter family protein [Firmicutes bacterium]|nr:Na/Pi cotransporter family protein [Bacillota bacterium]
MEIFYTVVALLGGLALFLYGMRIMGDGLKSSSGGAMKAALAKVTGKPIMGFLLGMVVACMIQSSTATIVLTVGLVGAGFLTFRQSVGIVLGANVGTAITAQIIRLMDVDAGAGSVLYFFKSDNLAPLALTIGIVLIMFVKGKGASSAGTICMGFGILFVGLMNMSSVVSSFGDELSHILVSFEGNYVLGFLSSVAVTGIIQSSSAVVGILQTIASSVGVHFCGVFAMIIGVNIGDCLTTYLVCRIGAKPEQIRTCLIHIIYNVCAAILIIAALFVLRQTGVLGDEIWYMGLKSGGVANIHGLFRLVPAICLLPFANVFARIAERIVPDSPEALEDSEIEASLRRLDERLIANPRLALDEAEQVLITMSEVATHNYDAAAQQLFEFEEAREDRIRRREDLLDRMADASNQYLVAISPNITLESDRRNQSFQLKALVCFERIGDLAVNIIDTLKEQREAGKEFSSEAQEEIRIAMGAVRDVLVLSSEAYANNDIAMARRVEPFEEVIDEMVEDLKGRHVERMMQGQCEVFSGIQFQNILLNLERVSDQCSDLAVYLLGRSFPEISGNEHEYLHNLHHANDPAYMEEFRKVHDRYFGELDQLYGTQDQVTMDLEK